MNEPKPKLPVGTNYCQCSACNEYFNSPAAFSKHRVKLNCMTVAEMLAKGMVVNGRGYWVTAPRGDV